MKSLLHSEQHQEECCICPGSSPSVSIYLGLSFSEGAQKDPDHQAENGPGTPTTLLGGHALLALPENPTGFSDMESGPISSEVHPL